MSVHLDTLPAAQQVLWSRLDAKALADFILYGGTALSLQLGHRISVDFDFFSSVAFNPEKLIEKVTLLKEARHVLQSAPNTFTCVLFVEEEPVKLSFLGDLSFPLLHPPVTAPNGIRIASIGDIFAHKLKTLHQRIEAKDYLDIIAILKEGHSLEEGLENMQKLFPKVVDPSLTLRTLTHFEGGDLERLGEEEKSFLKTCVAKTDILRISPSE